MEGVLAIFALLWAMLPLAVTGAYFVVYRWVSLSGIVRFFWAIPLVSVIGKVATLAGEDVVGGAKPVLAAIWWFESLILVLPLFALAVAGRPRRTDGRDATS